MIFNQDARAPWAALKSFQGCHWVPHTIITVICANMINKMINDDKYRDLK